MRYPTRRNGLIVPPAEIGFTVPTVEQLQTRGLTSIHHGYYPAPRFDSERYASVFRNLIDNTYPMLNVEHNQGKPTLHSRYREGVKRPSDSLMIEVVDDYLMMNGVIVCVKEHRTCSTYQIQPEEWRHIKKGYRNATGLGRRPSASFTDLAS